MCTYIDHRYKYYAFVSLSMTGLQRDRLLSYTANPDQANLDPDQANPDQANPDQANPDPNPGNESPPALVSLSPSSRALIKPIEVDCGEKCVADPCKIQRFRGKNIEWVLCEQCNSWLHAFCEHVTKQELKLIRKYICHSCRC